MVNVQLVSCRAGTVFGAVEGCFLYPIPGSTSPMIYRALRVIAGRTALGGGACFCGCGYMCVNTSLVHASSLAVAINYLLQSLFNEYFQ